MTSIDKNNIYDLRNLPEIKRDSAIVAKKFIPKPKPRKTNKPAAPQKYYDYSLGPREGNTRIVGPDSVSTHRFTITHSQNGHFQITPGQANTSSYQVENTIDNHFGTSGQGQRGDCFFLAEINSIRNTKDGQRILSQNVRHNNDGSITVTLPGAVAIRNQYCREGNGNKCEVTGVYCITQDAIQKAARNAGQSFSKGDLEVIALEIAMENYRAEMVQTQKNIGNKNTNVYNTEGSVAHLASNDYMQGGFTWDAGFILTGQKSDVYSASSQKLQNIKPYKAGEYGYISRAQMGLQSAEIGQLNNKGISEVNSVTRRDSDLDHMLDKYQGHEDEYAITFGVKVAANGPDGSTIAGNGHALSVVKITDDTVYVANPWFPDKIEPIPRAEFEKMATNLTVQKMNNKDVALNHVGNAISGAQHSSQHVNAQDVAVIQNLFNRINSNNSSNNNNASGHLSVNTIASFIHNYNNNSSDSDIDVSSLIKILNNLSRKTNLTKNERTQLEALYNQLSSSPDTKTSNSKIEIISKLIKTQENL